MKHYFIPLFMLCINLISCEKPQQEGQDPGAAGEKPTYEFVLKSGNNLYGQVTDAKTGAPLCGIPVTDGYNYTLTDEGGYYQMKSYSSDTEYARTVYLSVPADYEIPFGEDGYPSFYEYIDKDEDGLCRKDFKLAHRESVYEDFTIMSLADIHIKTVDNLARFTSETIPDLISTVSEGESNKIYKNTLVLTLGDNVWDTADQYGPFKASMSDLRLTNGRQLNVIPCIGNHDLMQKEGTTDFTVSKRYVDNFGPYDFSFDVGKVHFVFMRNFIRSGAGSGNTVATSGGFLDSQMKWLEQDLALVKDKEDKLLIFCGHYPVHENSTGNKDAFFKLLTQFHEVHCLTGHHHGVYNRFFDSYKAKGGKPMYDHNQVSAGGVWWKSNLNPDGVPNGYMIYNIKGNSVSAWYYKAVGAPVSQKQLRVYDGDASYEAVTGKSYAWTSMFSEVGYNMDPKGKYIVKVHAADTKNWDAEFVQDGKVLPMTRVTTSIYDLCAYVFSFSYPNSAGGYEPGGDRYKQKNTNYWYIDKSEVDLQKEWTVKAYHTLPTGAKMEYRSSALQSGFEGF